MNTITVDFSSGNGKIKPMHSVNNGPVGSAKAGKRKGVNFLWYQEAGIPMARTHDSAFYAGYGGEHIIDVHRIFKRFEADENDPASYTFEPTDKYIASIYASGTEVFYRLGACIEHRYKFGTYPPSDFQKWARICEHIIRHYNEGWADGFNYGIKYWEIWNEPDCDAGEGHNPCWQGTYEQFIDFFCTAIKHLKTCFPTLKVGGPALCFIHPSKCSEPLLSELKKRDLPLDFFSFHGYHNEPYMYIDTAKAAEKELLKYGFTETELILNEWNFVRGWSGPEYKQGRIWSKQLKGASFIAASMICAQMSPLDHFMYYDARPGNLWCGIFDSFTKEPIKGYYPFPMFNTLYQLGREAVSKTDDGCLYALGASGDGDAAVMLTYFSDKDDAEKMKFVKLSLAGISEGTWEVSYYLLDETHDNTLVRKENISFGEADVYLDLPLFSTYLVKLRKI